MKGRDGYKRIPQTPGPDSETNIDPERLSPIFRVLIVLIRLLPLVPCLFCFVLSKLTISRVLKVAIGLLLLVTGLFCTVLSKLTLISMTSQLRSALVEEESSVAVLLYWQLLFVMMVPQCITFLRTIVRGVCGKRTTTFPWPTVQAGVVGVAGSILEVGAMTCLVYLVLTLLPETAAIFSMNGIFMFQAFLNCWCDTSEEGIKGCVDIYRILMIVSGVFIQLVPIVTVSVFIGCKIEGVNLMLPIALPLCLIAISAVWCTKWQEVGTAVGKVWCTKWQEVGTAVGKERNKETKINIEQQDTGLNTEQQGTELNNSSETSTIKLCHESEKKTSRYRSNFINAVVRIILYPFVSYLIFWYALTKQTIDPWCLQKPCSISDSFKWSSRDLGLFIAQILGSFFGYIIIWISCTMGFHRWGLAIPLFLCTPVSILVYPLVTHHDPDHLFQNNSMEVTYFVGALWVGQMLVRGFSVFKHNGNCILATDTSMFNSPHYDGVLLEQQILLNWKLKLRDKKSKQNSQEKNKSSEGEKVNEKKKVFVCSTMYREDREEMKQLLSSIYKLACYCKNPNDQAEMGKNEYSFESHIFFDGGISGDNLSDFALQLLSLLNDSLHVEIKQCTKYSTPYGCMLSWTVEGALPFNIHLKDNAKIKNKKRWSQVMYMNYVLKYRVETLSTENLYINNTFIITTDADIKFEPKSVVLLLDTLNADPRVGAVCARTHPLGSGLIYWYQVFEYAIGHWLQKTAEHILGCVLCCPGCFSAFRCSALAEVVDEYSTEVSESKAIEFLTKDMGEDRWLCTLLVGKGWQLEYCAVSENHTHCPEDFDTFYKQRRRWIPSTLANLYLLITQASDFTKENDSVSYVFILYQGLLVFSTAISPATVILVIASGFSSAYNVSDASIAALIVILVLFSVAYGLFCIYGNPQYQMYAAKIASLILVIFMGVVFAGSIKNVVYDLLSLNDNCNSKEVCLIPTNGTYWFPLTPSTLYLFLFTFFFITTGILHLNEFRSLFHGVWYFLALPSGYLILIIYSAANLDDRSWGTREVSSGGEGSGPETFIHRCVNRVIIWWTGKAQNLNFEERKEKGSGPDIESEDEIFQLQYAMNETQFQLSDQVKRWLCNMGCQQYEDIFRQHGYFKLSFIAGMTAEDLKYIGVKIRGHIIRLERAAKELDYFIFKKPENNQKMNVMMWLEKLELPEYDELFKAAGYETADDLENLIGLTEHHLLGMGIHMRAHHKRLRHGMHIIHSKPLEEDVIQWLKENGCIQYAQKFEKEGYFNLHFCAGLKYKDLEAIGIAERGLIQRLEKAAKSLPALEIQKCIPVDVEVSKWLEYLELENYTKLFAAAGFQTRDDLESVKSFDAKDFRKIGVSKKAHVQRLLEAIGKLIYPTEAELKMQEANTALKSIHVDVDDESNKFWKSVVESTLSPIEKKSDDTLKEALKNLRNTALAVLLVGNIMWIVLLYSLEIPELLQYNISSRAFDVFFLAVYAVIIIVQFVAMIVHRGVTLVHYLARL